MPSESLARTVRKELLSLKSIFVVLFITAIYSYITAFLINYRLVLYPGTSLLYKITILTDLIPGLWTGMSKLDSLLFFLTSILVGLNILLIYKSIYFVRRSGKIKVTFGGATLIALATTGCLSCGVSVLSVLGLSASLSFLPLRGFGLHLLSIILLVFSFFYMLWQLHQSKYCRVKYTQLNQVCK